MKLSIVIVLASFLGCGDNRNGTETTTVDSGPTSCAYANTGNVAYQDCRVKTSDGFECVEGCGRLPDDGGLGTLLGVGCTVNISTSTEIIGLCVSSCSDCK